MSKQVASISGNRLTKNRNTKKLTLNFQQINTISPQSLNKNSPQATFFPTPHFPTSKLSRSKNLYSSTRNLRKIKLNPHSKSLISKSKLSRSSTRTKSSSSSTKKKQISSLVRQVNRSQTGENQYKTHLFQTFQALKFIKTLKQPDQDQIASKKIFLPFKKGCKKTVVFDLDQTLVHCVQNPQQGHIAVKISFPSGEQVLAGVNIRPFAREVLFSASKDYEVIVFTASHRCYADKVLDYIDPSGELIDHRLYRQNCLVIEGVHIKDLRVLEGRKIENIVIVDNAAYSFAFQIGNGIPIISWYDDMTDKELFKLMDYLKFLVEVKDIRKVNLKNFRLDTFCQDYIAEIVGEGNKENLENQYNMFIFQPGLF